jgi:hypothetical protein
VLPVTLFSQPSISSHQPAVAQADEGGDDDDDAHEHRSLFPANDPADDDHVGQRQGRAGQEQGQGRPLVHAMFMRAWVMGTSGQGGEVPKGPDEGASTFTP